MSKQLFTEAGVLLKFDSPDQYRVLLEADDSSKRFVLRNVPATILNKQNANGRIYSKNEMSRAIKDATDHINNRRLICTANDHPPSTHVPPIYASHIVTRAWVERRGNYDYLMNDWEIMETSAGKDLLALVKSGVSFGTSIRGLGSMNESNEVVNYEYLGTDVVGNPSAGTFVTISEDEAQGSKLYFESVNKDTNEVKQMNKFNADQAISTVRALRDEHGANSPKVIEAVAKFDTQLAVSDLTESEKTLAESAWNVFKDGMLGKASVTESADKSNLSEESASKTNILERKLEAATASNKALTEQALAFKKEAQEAKLQVEAGVKILKDFKEQVTVLRKRMNEQTVAAKKAVASKAHAQMEKMLNHLVSNSENMVKEIYENSIVMVKDITENFRRVQKRQEIQLKVTEETAQEVVRNFAALRTVATDMTETVMKLTAENAKLKAENAALKSGKSENSNNSRAPIVRESTKTSSVSRARALIESVK